MGWCQYTPSSNATTLESNKSERGRLIVRDETSDTIPQSCRGSGDSMRAQGRLTQHGKPYAVGRRDTQLEAREGQARLHRVAERPVLVRKPGNAGRAKGP